MAVKITITAKIGLVRGYEEDFVVVSGLQVKIDHEKSKGLDQIKVTHGSPFWSENDGQVSFAFPYIQLVSAHHKMKAI